MSDSVTRFFSSLKDALIEGRIDYITRHCVYPIPVFMYGDLIVCGSAETFGELLSQYREAVLAIGTVKIRPRLIAHGLPVRGYSNLWIEWDHLDAKGQCLRTNQIHYAVYQGAHDLFPRVELIELTVSAFPELSYDLPISLSA